MSVDASTSVGGEMPPVPECLILAAQLSHHSTDAPEQELSEVGGQKKRLSPTVTDSQDAGRDITPGQINHLASDVALEPIQVDGKSDSQDPAERLCYPDSTEVKLTLFILESTSHANNSRIWPSICLGR